MRVLIFEWLCGGGRWVDQTLPDLDCQFQRQGKAMLAAVCDDFLAAGCSLVVPLDARGELELPGAIRVLPVNVASDLAGVLQGAAQSCDAILIIAPEPDGRLVTVLDWLSGCAEKIISPNRDFVQLTSNKATTAAWLERRGIQVPQVDPLTSWAEAAEVLAPVVVKPIDGAGSDQVQYAEHPNQIKWPADRSKYRFERFVPGTPVSVGVIGGRMSSTVLPPMEQLFDRQPIGRYVGAGYPLPPEIASRATQLARRCVQALPSAGGYFGIDMVIANKGPNADCVVEINPRLTSSYVYLRKVVKRNLAAMMLSRCSGGMGSSSQAHVETCEAIPFDRIDWIEET